MPQFTVVSHERHTGKRWLRSSSHRFAAADAMVPVVGAELARAAVSMPLAFVEHEGRYSLVAVLSLTSGRNLFVAPDGRWLGSYVPACYRAYPFGVVPKQGTDEVMLVVDEDSGLVTDARLGGEAFFDDEGKLSPALKSIFDFLIQLETSRRSTQAAVSALAEAGIIQPWPITVKTEQGEQPIRGLYRVDEAGLNALPDGIFLTLRKAAALPVAYAHLLSTAQIGLFSELTKLQAQLGPPLSSTVPENLDSIFGLTTDDTIRFR